MTDRNPSEDFDRQLQAARRWAMEARDAGWLTDAAIEPLLHLENKSPAGLFEAGEHRPLVAAFFGGTGVGKSSLLNRLARQPIARVGVERPTSREVTIFLHESLQIRHLPAGFPVDRVRISRHADDRRRQVLWIDMPDIDSTESTNRDLVIEWLPHIDVLIYVVNPERYRDDKGWRMLREHVNQHAWLFVLNQWDMGQELQYLDFVKLLKQGGFTDPVIFRTDCRPEADRRPPDEFAQLETALQTLADTHLIEQLERRAREARQAELHAAVAGCVALLGDTAAFGDLRAQLARIWETTVESLQQGMHWPIIEVARAFVHHDANPLRRAIKLQATDGEAVSRKKPAPPSILWDDWAQLQLQDALHQMVAETAERRLPIAPLKPRLSAVLDRAPKLITDEAQRALRASLANPGNAAQRFFLKFTGWCSMLLPLAAIGWVAWQAVTAYYQSALTHGGFLGVDFAVHSLLIILIAWLLPFFLHQQLKPSHERTAQKGLRNGMSAGLARVHLLAEDALAGYQADLATVVQQGRQLLIPVTRERLTGPDILERMMPITCPETGKRA